jgi:membrane-associated protease RseP (regulator of RpoE activity)
VACRGLDAQVVRPEDPELTQLLHQFVPVRITNFRGVDMNRFRFDYDLTFAILMMSPEGHVYSRFGTRDAKSETDRMSIAGLKHTVRQVLALHRQRPPVSSAGDPLPRFTLDDIPAFSSSNAAKQKCAHCHFAHNFRFEQMRNEGKFTKAQLFQYPLPENIGVTLEVDRNNVVQSVRPGSPAQRSGVKAGDMIVGAGQTPVLTTADLQFALNSVPDAGTVKLDLERGGQHLRPAALRLPRGWRRTDISWRASQDGVAPTVGIWGEALDGEQKKQHGLPPDRLALRVTFLFPGPAWAKTRGGLQKDDVIVGINGRQSPPMTIRQFHAYFRLNFDVGQTQTLNVLRGEQRLAIKAPCMEVRDD